MTAPPACRVCGSPSVTAAGRVEYLEGVPHLIQDCAECGCRFTTHDPAVHDRLHTRPAISYYDDYRLLAERSRDWFRAGDAERLRAELLRSTKYRFILDQVSRQPQSARLLEVGCARGHLTSYFVLMGRPILGVDVSTEAIDFGARRVRRPLCGRVSMRRVLLTMSSTTSDSSAASPIRSRSPAGCWRC